MKQLSKRLNSMFKPEPTPLAPEALEALQAFAAAYGHRWKAALRDCWYRASYPRMTANQSGWLQRLRNDPSFSLEKFKLPKEKP